MLVKAPRAHSCLGLFFQRCPPKASDAWLEMKHCSLVVLADKEKSRTDWLLPKNINKWMVICQSGAFKIEADRKQAWARMLEFSWSDGAASELCCV